MGSGVFAMCSRMQRGPGTGSSPRVAARQAKGLVFRGGDEDLGAFLAGQAPRLQCARHGGHQRHEAGGPLRSLRLWIYAHPVPFDDELADLLAAAGCKGVSLSAEHIVRERLAVWTPPRDRVGLAYTLADVQRLTDALSERGIMITAELLLGLPSETIETVKQTIDVALQLRTTVVGFTLGLQVFPHAPLGIRFAAESQGTRAIPGLQSNTATRPILLTPLERREVLELWNDTSAPHPEATIPALFEAQVALAPDAVALTFEDRALSYRALSTRGNQLAHALRRLGVGPDSIVGLCVERSPEMVVGMLGVMKAGGAYLPLDPAYPADRLAFMVDAPGQLERSGRVHPRNTFAEECDHLLVRVAFAIEHDHAGFQIVAAVVSPLQ